ncbi:ribosome hibernation-promoting factor, HPF/YfiA family [Rathayibacter iranicus]|uniref:Ribosome hibernation promoting factor n=2 Tax=Rathayibacter iranicus TaxID=59737 RepID=A0AAD1AFT4_9MICO|nr:ribosome-associated translation inhibitor RaiA [Rathayibacter iranicus]AZZ55764.1 ribosome-associated translation inhibitor RaiA [Rathayibacter iranicus]MWV30812.1 ribosome-associated translation inhibitor RaiA [Rathayibacter iranicus NCPPB 2253 = VKM Ac-1602]PPI47532.1 ribosome-associated translation inhibitor RaiA [Rathayibacter iranicus]PPI60377.1 ribosome-associated translation inhibitor RaiA [Rathayibacter iranicus]PPI72160.1 ribosome-associated translation inhibitor RaiA [Rathayibacte
MDIDITGRNIDITDRFRAYATEKSDKVAHLADRALALEIKASRHAEGKGASGGDRVELTLIGKGPVVRAEASGADKYAAFDVAIGRLLERVRRAKDRRKVHRGQHRPTSLRDAAADDFSVVAIQPADAAVLEQLSTGVVPVQASEPEPVEDEVDEPYCPVVIRKKVFASVSMTVDDAVDYMELVGHDFYLFIDSETDRPSVVYRRKGWDYGVIGLGDETDELAEQTAS